MVRSYEDADYERLKELYQHSEWYGGVFDEARDGRERLASKIASDPEAILVYEKDGELVGTISIIEDGRVAWLYRFVVKDNDKDVAAELYDAATANLKARGHSEALVYTPADNETLASRYDELGMTPGGNYTCYYKEL
ncbi:GNAT family N-acetyltransferase [Candidatus Saccharibacteria bacterium]|nr:MAG: GNAT family N-acetyltransferase [Candidatus Saccharibacteria bacterium]